MLLVNPGSYFRLLISTNTDGPACSGKVATFYGLNSNKYPELREHLKRGYSDDGKKWKQASELCSQWMFSDTTSGISESHSHHSLCTLEAKLKENEQFIESFEHFDLAIPV